MYTKLEERKKWSSIEEYKGIKRPVALLTSSHATDLISRQDPN